MITAGIWPATQFIIHKASRPTSAGPGNSFAAARHRVALAKGSWRIRSDLHLDGNCGDTRWGIRCKFKTTNILQPPLPPPWNEGGAARCIISRISALACRIMSDVAGIWPLTPPPPRQCQGTSQHAFVARSWINQRAAIRMCVVLKRWIMNAARRRYVSVSGSLTQTCKPLRLEEWE